VAVPLKRARDHADTGRWGDRTPPPPLAQPTHERPNRPGWPRPRLRGGPSADWRWPWTSDWWWSCWTCCGGSGA